MAHDDWLASDLGAVPDLDAGIERVHVAVQDVTACIVRYACLIHYLPRLLLGLQPQLASLLADCSAGCRHQESSAVVPDASESFGLSSSRRASSPLTNAGDASVDTSPASRTASLIATASGTSLPHSSS